MFPIRWRQRRGPRCASPAQRRTRRQIEVERLESGALAFTGITANLTTGTLATVSLQYEVFGETITGAVAISAPLTGSGPLTGTVVGNRIAFTTTSDTGTITWTGIIAGRHLCGLYWVSRAGIPVPEQIGVWSVSR